MTAILRKPHQPRGSKGFTLLELLVVVAIIGVLATIAIPVYTSYINKAKLTLAHGALDSIRKTLETYHIDYQQYPDSIDFTTGEDGLGRTVFDDNLRAQIANDLFSIGPYVPGAETYTLTARANDDDHTLFTLTPNETIY